MYPNNGAIVSNEEYWSVKALMAKRDAMISLEARKRRHASILIVCGLAGMILLSGFIGHGKLADTINRSAVVSVGR